MKRRTLLNHFDRIVTTYGKMLFLSGPRQVGKTTLAKMYGKANGGSIYFNWDILTDRKKFQRTPYFFEDEDTAKSNIVIFDEIHKHSKWKNYLKGVFDKHHDDFRFIVTGSGRLDLFQKGGDSLLGRYLPLPLFPFTLSELEERYVSLAEFQKTLTEGPASSRGDRVHYDALFTFGGFPEPLLRGEMAALQLWQQEHRTRLIREDIRDASRIRDLSLLETLTHLLEQRVGAPLSFNSLREDISVSFETVRDWIGILGQFYYLFQILPFTGSIKRSIRKETKAYLFDWAEVDDPALRFENFIAASLLKSVKTWRALGEGDTDLLYLRDKEKREVDFVLTLKKKPFCLIEAKYSDETLSPHLLYYQEKLSIPAVVQVVHKPGILKKTQKNGLIQWVISADRWLTCLP